VGVCVAVSTPTGPQALPRADDHRHRVGRGGGGDPMVVHVCDDEGVISNWADTLYDLRRRRLSVAGDVDEVIVSDETAAVLRELVLLDPTVSGWCLACAPTPTALPC
jgi:hypothetical protein